MSTLRIETLAFVLMAFLATTTLHAEIEWEPDIYPLNNFFPSLAIGTARVDPTAEIFSAWEGFHAGDPQGIIGASIAGLKKGDKFKLVIEGNDLMKQSTFEGSIKKAPGDADFVIHPKISYQYDRLGGITQVAPFDISMELFVNGVSQGAKTTTVTVRSINDCLFGVQEDEESNSDYSWLFAAYVNENHPWVDRILKEALQSGIVSSFDGYQAGDDDNVLQQIFAIWNVMQRRGMRYSDITTTAAETDGVYSQHVRLFDQSVDAAQANCVDGTVLLAALLRKIGLRPSLVIVPGHMFLAVDLDDENYIGLETTMMGDNTIETADSKKIPVFEKLPARIRTAARESFEEAVTTGTDRLNEDAKKFESEDLEYQIIDLGEARKAGILPIRFGGSSLRTP